MTLVKKYALLPLTLLAFVVDTQAQPPACQDVHVWYSMALLHKSVAGQVEW